jgi:hypothetical protein
VTPHPALALLGAVALAAVHLFAERLRFLDRLPRSRWLSFGGGTSVAYVFVHLLPELNEAQEMVEEATIPELLFLEHHAYLMALAGLTVFYGLERLAQGSREESVEAGRGDRTGLGVFRVHVGSFALYNALIGYLLVRSPSDTSPRILFFVAMALHLSVNDYGLRSHHKEPYHRVGRWLLAGAVLAGGVLGVAVRLPELALLIPLAFLGGAVVLNVLKEELPEERESRFGAFALGVVGYAALLVAM